MRLTTRLFLLISFLIALSVGTAVAVTWFWSGRIGREAITERLEKGSELRRQQDEALYDRLQLVANVFVADANLIAYVAEALDRTDSGSILDLLLERQDDLGFDFAAVTDPDGYLLARTDRLSALDEDLADVPLIAEALDDFESAGLWVEGEEIYHAVVIPLVQGGIDLIGFFATAYRVDDVGAVESRRLDGSEVVIVSVDSGAPLASSFDEARQPLAHAALAGAALAGPEASAVALSDSVREVAIGGEPWLVHRSELFGSSGDPVAVRLTGASLRAETAPFRRIASALGLIGLATALLGFLLTYGLARRLTRPLAALIGAAKKARAGDYAAQIPTARADEVGELGTEFKELLNELREKRDMETYVAELSRKLPDPVQLLEKPMKSAHRSEVTVLAVEYRIHGAEADPEPVAALSRLGADLREAARRIRGSRGVVASFSGHRVLAVFEGDDHLQRAVKVAIEVVKTGSAWSPGEPDAAPAVALAADSVVLGMIEWESQGYEAVCGRAVQLIETLLREAAPGELLMPLFTRDRLLELTDVPPEVLPERQGITTALRHCSLDLSHAPALPTLTLEGSGDAAAERPIFQPGQVVADRFEILSLAGTGGMGAVYRVRDRRLGEVVALKTLRDGAWKDRERIERLKQEIKIARAISHPHVLRVYDLGEADGVPFISMEYVPGVTLRQMLEQAPRLPFSAAMRLARQIVQGLDAVHATGILHLDIKPDNVLLEPTGNARLTDFGISSPLDSGREGAAAPQRTLGTPYYVAPEIVRGEGADARADLFSTGVLLFELFTGGRPFRTGQSVAEVFRIKLEEPAATADSIWPDVPPVLAAVLAKCLEKDPDQRYAAAADLLADLDRVL